jgi:hypothetical protein
MTIASSFCFAMISLPAALNDYGFGTTDSVGSYAQAKPARRADRKAYRRRSVAPNLG